jgi:hypothetical protein
LRNDEAKKFPCASNKGTCIQKALLESILESMKKKTIYLLWSKNHKDGLDDIEAIQHLTYFEVIIPLSPSTT